MFLEKVYSFLFRCFQSPSICELPVQARMAYAVHINANSFNFAKERWVMHV